MVRSLGLARLASLACWVGVSLLTPAPIAMAAVEDLAVTDQQQVSKRRVGRAHFDYTYTVTLSNGGGPLENVTATVSSLSTNTQIREETVIFGSVSSGQTQSTDTFTMRQNRRVLFNPADLVWTFTADEPISNTAPTADAGTDQTVPLAASVTLTGIGSSDPEDDPLTYLWTLVAPATSAATLSSNTALDPEFVVDVAGLYRATLIVNDGDLNSTADTVEVTAIFSGNNPPSIQSTPITAGSLGASYSYDVNATDPDQGDTLVYSLTLAPPGMTIDANSGLINWTPGATGPADVDLLVTDSTGLTARQLYLILVNTGSGDEPPTLAPIADQETSVGLGIMAVAMATDPEGEAIRYSLIQSPDGMVINTTNGELFWTPDLNQAGSFSATVSATDPGGQVASISFNVLVNAEQTNNAPTISPVSDSTLSAIGELALTLQASDPDVGDVLTFSLAGAPTALQFDSNSGRINWIPSTDDAGTLNLTARVTDSAGASDSTAFSITVVEPNSPPVAHDDAYTVDRDEQLQIPALGVLANDTDANNDVLSALNTTTPILGSLDSFPGDGGFNYTPPAVQPITIGLQEQCRSEFNSRRAHRGQSVIVGDIDADGDPEIVSFTPFSFNASLWIMDPSDCSLEVPPVVLSFIDVGSFSGVASIALVNLDADPELEIVAVRNGPPGGGLDGGRLVAFNADGSYVWSLPDGASEAFSLTTTSSNNLFDSSPIITDLDGDGSPEILMKIIFGAGGGKVPGIIAFNADGTIRWEYQGVVQTGDTDAKPVYLVDLDLDGTLEVIFHTNVISHDGAFEFLLPQMPTSTANIQTTHLTLAVANFDNDPFPELVGRDEHHNYLYEHTGAIAWSRPARNTSTSEITVANLDGDAAPEFAYHTGLGSGASSSWLAAFDTNGDELWSHEGTDLMSNAVVRGLGLSATAFDFDRNGIDDLAITLFTEGRDDGMFIFRGSDGVELARDPNVGEAAYTPLSTITQIPTIADVDGDGSAELLYPIGTGFAQTQIMILEGLDGNPFAPSRPIRNQWLYQPTHVNVDGSVPAYPTPHWLVPGLNMFHGAPIIPFEDPGLTDEFRYTAADASTTSNEATVTIAVTNVNAPTIISTPALGASPDFNYEYGLLSTDGDFGDTFTYVLVDAPNGMSISAVGIISWTPVNDDLGPHRVQVVVTDSQGNTDEQTYTLTVLPPVSVPNLLSAANAGDADQLITEAGLAVGRVTEAFSFTVPLGQLISQSVAPSSNSAAGSFINYVVSLGPQPIFVPDLSGLTSVGAQALLDTLALDLGSVSNVNSDTVPKGLTISQGTPVNQQVAIGTAVDITLSSGPMLVVELDQRMVPSGDSIGLSITVFDIDGVALAPQPPVSVSVSALPDSTVGAAPIANLSSITTALDTRGGFALTVDAGVFGSQELAFAVRADLTAEPYYAPFADLAARIDDIRTLYVDMVEALLVNDTLAVQALAVQLRDHRDAIDLDEIASRTPFAIETGFIPSYAEASSGGFPASFGELDQLPGVFAQAERSIEESIAFLDGLDPNRARDDNVRARFLNNQLALSMDNLTNFQTSVGALVFVKSEAYQLLAQQIPRLVLADLNASVTALTEAGLLAQVGSSNVTQLASVEDFYAETRPTLFSLVGIMSATSIRTTIMKKVYVPYITRLIASGMVLAKAEIQAGPKDGEIQGIITGASLSFHKFRVQNSVLEAIGLSDDAASMEITITGPDGFNAALAAAIAVAEAKKPWERQLAIDNLEFVEANFNAGSAVVRGHEVIRGCIFTSDSACSQLVIGFGFSVVHSGGGFPAPVFIRVVDKANDNAIHAGVFAFFPN